MFFSAALATAALALVASAHPIADDHVHGNISARAAPARVYSGCTQPNQLALTFDDGPYQYTKDLVNTLDAAGIKATFFVNGNNYGCIYDYRDNVKYAYDHGHVVGSHTWGHLHLNSLSYDKLHDEMWKVELALMRITGGYPALMRPPYGEYNDLVKRVAGERGQSLILWDFDSGDSVGKTPAQSKQEYVNLINRRPSNVLALNHETYSGTVYDVIPNSIPKLKAAGYQFVTVAQCLGIPAYQSVAAPQTPDASWRC